MSVKELLDKKIADREEKREAERQRALRESERQRDQLKKVCDQIEASLEGLVWRKLQHRGEYHVRYMRHNVYIEARWHRDKVRYADDCPEEDVDVLKIGISTRAVNCAECYLCADTFEDSFANFLLQLR